MTNVDALKALYTALGGESAGVAGADTTLDCLNAIAALLGSSTTADTNAEAITAIAAVAPFAVAPALQDRTVTPTTSSQEITKTDADCYGLGTVTVSAVTAAIDANIIPENIKSGVAILGVTGSYSG